jgi:hypothetical protein
LTPWAWDGRPSEEKAEMLAMQTAHATVEAYDYEQVTKTADTKGAGR